MSLQVHGGGGLRMAMAASDGSLPEGLEGLDSHVLDAAPRARLTFEDKLEREFARRREMELERRLRIFDAKRRTIGVDKEVLDAQVAEKERRREEEKKSSNTGNREMLELDRQLKIMEAEKGRIRFELERECRTFSKAHLAKEMSHTFDLNDPQNLRKDRPMREGDYDSRCGPASMLKFGGEDLMKDERVKQQHLQQTMFIEQQLFEKAMMKEESGDAQHAKETAEMIALRNEMEANEYALRKELQKNQQDSNLAHGAQRAQEKADRLQLESERDQAELDHHAANPFLNETVTQQHAGRVRCSEYKGSTRDEKVQGRLILEDQAHEQGSGRFNDKVGDLQFAHTQEQTRRQLLLQEREKARQSRQIREQVSQVNQQLRVEKDLKSKETNQLYTNKFSDDFFAQFGKGTR